MKMIDEATEVPDQSQSLPEIIDESSFELVAEGRLLSALPAWLDGSQGTNRCTNRSSLISADSDIAAIEEWLGSKSQSSHHTLRLYRREAYRLFAWSVCFREKPLSSLMLDDVNAFADWLKQPVEHPMWAKHNLKLSRGCLSLSSQANALRVCSALFSWLMKAAYIQGNPFALYSRHALERKNEELKQAGLQHYLPIDLCTWIDLHIDEFRPTHNRAHAQLVYERQRFAYYFLSRVGLRRSEFVNARMSDFRNNAGQWQLSVLGKGRTIPEWTTVTPAAMDALRRYRSAMGLPPDPGPDETEIPVISALDSRKPITDHFLNEQLKVFLRRMALALPKGSAEAKALGKATAHWMRHTLASNNAEAEVPLAATANQLRHKSLDTTRKVYEHRSTLIQTRELSRLDTLMHERSVTAAESTSVDDSEPRA